MRCPTSWMYHDSSHLARSSVKNDLADSLTKIHTSAEFLNYLLLQLRIVCNNCEQITYRLWCSQKVRPDPFPIKLEPNLHFHKIGKWEHRGTWGKTLPRSGFQKWTLATASACLRGCRGSLNLSLPGSHTRAFADPVAGSASPTSIPNSWEWLAGNHLLAAKKTSILAQIN